MGRVLDSAFAVAECLADARGGLQAIEMPMPTWPGASMLVEQARILATEGYQMFVVWAGDGEWACWPDIHPIRVVPQVFPGQMYHGPARMRTR